MSEILTEEERAWLAENQYRCERCHHLEIFHHNESGVCGACYKDQGPCCWAALSTSPH